MITVSAEPDAFAFTPASTALMIIDMQRDFVHPGGFGASLGNDVGQLLPAIAPTRRVLETARSLGMTVIHTREGHRSDLGDLHPAKQRRGRPATGIGDPGPMGRVLIRGEPGHAIIDELAPAAGEPIVDKPGKGSFYATDLDVLLHTHRIERLIITGVTTEVCVASTVREANDRGYECLVVSDCTASYVPEFHTATLAMIPAQAGILGWVADSAALHTAITAQHRPESGSEEQPCWIAQ